ncbi:MAG: hypothetical protein U1F36_02665 [Planctomycetota bacterium]
MGTSTIALEPTRLDPGVARREGFELAVRVHSGRARAWTPSDDRLLALGARFDEVLRCNEETARVRGGTDGTVFDWLDADPADPLTLVARHPQRSLCALGISRSLPSLLADVLGAAFCDPHFLPDIGAASKEIVRIDAGDLLQRVIAARSGVPAALDGFLDESLRPLDDRRARAAELCARLALEFEFLHLLQHVLGGHTTDAASLGGAAPQALCNLPRAVDANRRLERHQHEVHADTWAATALARMLRRGHTILVAADAIAQAPLDPLRALALGIGFARRIEQATPVAIEPWATSDHPTPPLRLAAIGEVLGENLAALDLELGIAARAAFDEFGATSSDADSVASASSDAAAVLASLRERTPRLRWAHQLVVPD